MNSHNYVYIIFLFFFWLAATMGLKFSNSKFSCCTSCTLPVQMSTDDIYNQRSHRMKPGDKLYGNTEVHSESESESELNLDEEGDMMTTPTTESASDPITEGSEQMEDPEEIETIKMSQLNSPSNTLPITDPTYRKAPNYSVDSASLSMEPVPSDVPLMLKRQRSRELIKKHVEATYDVTVPDPSIHGHSRHSASASEIRSHFSPISRQSSATPPPTAPSHLINEYTDRHWSREDIERHSRDMTAELEYLHSINALSSSALSPSEEMTPNVLSPNALSPNALSSNGTTSNNSTLSSSPNGLSVITDSHSHGFPSGSRTETKITLEREPSSSQIFHVDSAQNWTVKDIENAKSEMAKHMVHLHANMLETE